LKDNLHGKHWIKRFNVCLENLNCLYEIASSLEISTLELALILQPLVQTGEIKMLSYQEIKTDQRPLIAYVDQRETRQRIMTYLLENSGFRLLILDDPFKALSKLLNSPPCLIIIHANLPEMNGFQLCNFCRKSSQLKDVPILLLDERENFIGKIRAKLANASGYLSESLVPQKLAGKIEGLLQESKTIA
jgi:twitching motility two-component system response regulator PilG